MIKNKRLINLIKDFTKVILIAFIITGLIKLFVFEAYTIYGSSMNPNFTHDDELIVLKATYGPRIPVINVKLPMLVKPKKGQILVFQSIEYKRPKWYQELLNFITLERINFEWKKKEKMIIKRILAEPGDRIQLVDNNSQQIYINGKLIGREFVSNLENNKLGSKKSLFKEINGGKQYLIQYNGTLPVLNNNNKKKESEIYIPKKNDVLTIYKLKSNTIMKICINGEKMSDKWRELRCLERINEETKKNLLDFEDDNLTYTIKNNYYFVRGDNRISEYSSRDSTDWGILREELIIGSPVFRVFPLKKFGLIN